MRFHIGFSKRISWKWLLLIIGGLLAFFGIGNHDVLAYTGVTNTPTSAGVLSDDNGANYTLNISPRTGGVLGDNYYINFGTPTCGGVDCDPVFNGYVYWNYPAKNLCTSGMIHYKFSYFTRSTTPPVIFPTNNFSTNYSMSNARLVYDSTNKKWTVTLDVPNNQAFQIRLGFENDYNTNYYFVSSAVQKNWEYSCDYSLADSTNDIISNNDANTQKITDKLENKCPNLYNFNNGATYSVTATHDDSDFYIQDKVYLQAGKTYYFKWKSNKPVGISGDTSEILLLKDGQYNTIIFINDTKNAVLNITQTGEYMIRFDCNKNGSTCTLYDVMISEVNTPYCRYGSYTSLFDSTQQITNALEENINSITHLNDTLIDGSLPQLPDFVIENMAISSQTQRLFMLPIQLLNSVVGGMDSCTPLRIDLTPIMNLGNGGTYVLTIPCMGQRIKNYIGSNWYDIFDSIMACVVFYYVASNIVLRIQQLFSGVDTLPSYYTSHGRTKSVLVDSSTGEVIGNG